MNEICRNIFRAVHEGKWLKIEYLNKNGETTHYWIGIKSIDVSGEKLIVDGLDVANYRITELRIFIRSIKKSSVLDNTFFSINDKLINDIENNPQKYNKLFHDPFNLKILTYYEKCNQMDCVPYTPKYKTIDFIDEQILSETGDTYKLSTEQYHDIVSSFNKKTNHQENRGNSISKRIGLNVLGVNTREGLYVLAYKELRLDVVNRTLKPSKNVTVCYEYTIDGKMFRARRFLEADDCELMEDFENNRELIKDKITGNLVNGQLLDDMPHLVELQYESILDIHSQYDGIVKMIESNEMSMPIKAFWGELTSKPKRRSQNFPMAFVNRNINLDQLLVINNAMKYPVTYVQGPPGTGKTNTIVNTISTAFFNERTVLFTSYNNKPVNDVFMALSTLKYRDKVIPFPVLRCGNREEVLRSIEYIKSLQKRVVNVQIYEDTLNRKREDKTRRAKQLSDLMIRYEDRIELLERRDTVNGIIDFEADNDISLNLLSFYEDLKNRQMKQIERNLEKHADITEEEALELADQDDEEFFKYLYYTSAALIKKLDTPEYSEFVNILHIDDDVEKVKEFNHYLSKSENVLKLQRVFPVIMTTCISAYRIGEPEVLFDMTIIDEASQCNTAMSLVPILRGRNLMLVGDPEQLNPVIVLSKHDNDVLRKMYNITDEYDYCTNSVYKTFMATDSVSDETLLHMHYRCDPSIIEFNNKKYYNGKLVIKTNKKSDEPLIYMDTDDSGSNKKNTSYNEAEQIVKYVKKNSDKNIGIITPFVNQKELIDKMMQENGINDVSCGTVHAFQGDQKDIILFSTAITGKTSKGTYNWLKNNKELINVATSRASEKLVVLSSLKQIDNLREDDDDDLYELIQYVRSKGKTVVTPKGIQSRALGFKPWDTKTEKAFLECMTHALDNIMLSQNKYEIKEQVVLSQIFKDNVPYSKLFYSGSLDFVIYEKRFDGLAYPVLAIELDGNEHKTMESRIKNDREKERICKAQGLELVRVDNSYARRYAFIKDLLKRYFAIMH